MIDSVGCFTDVDRTHDPSFFVRFLDEANALPAVQASKALLVEELRLGAGRAVLDVGCGTGDDVLAMAKIVGGNGRVVGVDLSQAMITEASARSTACELPVEYWVGDAQALPFWDGVFDACRAERVLMHVRDVDRALSEMVRVTRVGGRIAVLDLDFDTLVLDSPDRETTRIVVRSISDGIRHGWIGRQLPRMFETTGLVEVQVTPSTISFDCDFLALLTAGHLDELRASETLCADEATHWWGRLRQAQQAGTFFGAISAFIVAGTKAGPAVSYEWLRGTAELRGLPERLAAQEVGRGARRSHSP